MVDESFLYPLILDNKSAGAVVRWLVVLITGGGATKPSAAPDEAGEEEAAVLTIEGVGTTIGVTFWIGLVLPEPLAAEITVEPVSNFADKGAEGAVVSRGTMGVLTAPKGFNGSTGEGVKEDKIKEAELTTVGSKGPSLLFEEFGSNLIAVEEPGGTSVEEEAAKTGRTWVRLTEVDLDCASVEVSGVTLDAGTGVSKSFI